MTLIKYDVSKVQRRPRLEALPIADQEPERRRSAPGSFDDRVTDRVVDLMQLIEEGVPPMEYLPASDGMLVRGKRHLIAAPAKTGKSIAMLAHAVDMTLAGAKVTVLDRENSKETYAYRLRDICQARNLDGDAQELIREGLQYVEYPRLKADDGEALAEAFGDEDLVLFDAQRMFLTDLGLKESEADDYAAFMASVVDPLFRERVSTLILDNTGHKDRDRARGSVTKGDLNEVMFSLSSTPFDMYQRGLLTLKVEASRFGNRGEWKMEIGGGHYGSWLTNARLDRPDFREAALKVLAADAPLGVDKLVDGCRRAGVKVGNDDARSLLATYVEDGTLRHSPNGYERGVKGHA